MRLGEDSEGKEILSASSKRGPKNEAAIPIRPLHFKPRKETCRGAKGEAADPGERRGSVDCQSPRSSRGGGELKGYVWAER